MTGKSSDPATPGRVTDSKRGYRVGVDIGGTFTDLALLAGDGSVFTRTLLTSPDQHGRIRSPELYNLMYLKPSPLVPRRHRLEVNERINRLGQVVRPLDLAQTDRVLRQLAEAVNNHQGRFDPSAACTCIAHQLVGGQGVSCAKLSN